MCTICEAARAHELPTVRQWGPPSQAGAQTSGATRITAPDAHALTANAQAKPSFAYDEAAAQISWWNAKWDDEDASTGVAIGGAFDENGLGSPGTVTYGFLAQGGITASLPGIGDSSDHRALTAAEIAQVERAIRLIEDVAGIDFVRVRGPGGTDLLTDPSLAEIDIVGDLVSAGFAMPSFAGGEISASLVNIGVDGLDKDGTYAFLTALHELGHAVGLAHPGDYNAGQGDPSYGADAAYFEDSRQYTVMSYWSEGNTGGSFGGRFANAPMLHDVAALQRLYGANEETRAGNTVYGFGSNTGDGAWTLTSSSDGIVGAIWDAGGTDAIDASGYFQDQVIDLRQEAFSSLGGMTNNLAIARGTVIEDAHGGRGDDLIVANAASNRLDGGEGLDTVSFEAARAGVRADLRAREAVVDNGVDGRDTLTGFERVIGSEHDDWLAVGAVGFRIEGGAGDDTLLARSPFGTFVGGEGTDLADLSAWDFGVSLSLLEGMEAQLGTRFEGVESVVGTGLADLLTGTDEANTLRGGGGDDTLIGLGGGDLIEGGPGDDLIILGSDDFLFG